jgi:nitrite reductase (NADH) small subunit
LVRWARILLRKLIAPYNLVVGFEKVASLDELPEGAVLEIVRGHDLYALCNVRGEVRALAGVCPHHGGPIGQGALDGDIVSCPWHAWPFDSATGACAFNPDVRIPTYAVRMQGGDILVDLPESDA